MRLCVINLAALPTTERLRLPIWNWPYETDHSDVPCAGHSSVRPVPRVGRDCTETA